MTLKFDGFRSQEKNRRRLYASCILGPRLQLSYIHISSSSHSCSAENDMSCSATQSSGTVPTEAKRTICHIRCFSLTALLWDLEAAAASNQKTIMYNKLLDMQHCGGTLRSHSPDVSGFAGSRSSFTFNSPIPVQHHCHLVGESLRRLFIFIYLFFYKPR